MLSLPGPRTALAAAGALAVLVVTAAPLPALAGPEDDLEAARRRANRAAAEMAEAEEQLARASDSVARVETRVARVDSRTTARTPPAGRPTSTSRSTPAARAT